jgi:hypothetical protein
MRFFALGVLLLASQVAQAQLSYTTNNGSITITSYSLAAGSTVVIPNTINGLPVTRHR